MEKKLFGILKSLQKEVGIISKDSKNPFYNSKYFDINSLIEHIKPLLEKYELLLIQPLTNIDGRPAIKTIISCGDENYTSEITLPDLQDPQKMGSAITYYRRYAIQSLLLLQAEDDDANKTVEQKQDNHPFKICPVCKKEHSGKYDKCFDCFKAGK